jgi:hypothetical protein
MPAVVPMVTSVMFWNCAASNEVAICDCARPRRNSVLAWYRKGYVHPITLSAREMGDELGSGR